MSRARTFRFVSLLALAGYSAAIFWYATRQGPELPWIEHYWDKAKHAAAFFVMSGLTLLALGYPRLSARKCAVKGSWAVLYALLFGVAIEVAQSRVPGRDAEAADVVADVVGAAGALILATLHLRRSERLKRTNLSSDGASHAPRP